LILIVDGRAYLESVATHKICCCAAYGIGRAICPPTGGPPVKSRVIFDLSLLKTLKVGETPGFLWLSEFEGTGAMISFRVRSLTLPLLRSRIVTIWPSHIALQHLLTICGVQAIASVLRKRLRRLRSKRHPTSVQGVASGSPQ
jgi:hypothetical protein